MTQSVATKLAVLTLAVLIPVTGVYSFTLMQKQIAQAEQGKAMAVAAGTGEGVWAFNETLPVVLGTGSVLGFLEANPVERITVVYEPLLWSVSRRIVMVEFQGKQHAYYPSDMETQIFADKAVIAPWGNTLAFVPRAELSPSSVALFERLDQRFASARPQSEKDGWKAGVSGALSVALTLGVLAFLFFQLRGQRKSLKFIEPTQVQGSTHHRLPGGLVKYERRRHARARVLAGLHAVGGRFAMGISRRKAEVGELVVQKKSTASGALSFWVQKSSAYWLSAASIALSENFQ